MASGHGASDDDTAAVTYLPADETPSARVLAGLKTARTRRETAERKHRRTVARLVAEGRAAGLSWDRMGRALEVTGEALRRRFGGRSIT